MGKAKTRAARRGAEPAEAHPITPIFRWAGSKRKQLSTLQRYWRPEFKRYVEPFAGSASLYFRLQPRRALLGDINSALIEAYEVIRDDPDGVSRAVRAIPRGKRRYYAQRARNPRRLNRFNRAVRFVYLNRYCFNGIYRTNVKGDFNVPYAHTKPGMVPPVEEFRKCAMLLRQAKLRCADFGAILSSVRRGDFVFLDPPYVVAARRVFRQYDKREFTQRDLNRLAKHLVKIDRRGAKFVLTYADCREARVAFASWGPRRIRVRRHVAGFADGRRSSYELLVTNVENRS
jgi:DNA adenine methylase